MARADKFDCSESLKSLSVGVDGVHPPRRNLRLWQISVTPVMPSILMLKVRTRPHKAVRIHLPFFVARQSCDRSPGHAAVGDSVINYLGGNTIARVAILGRRAPK
jgi:hypothetical protein